MEKIQPIVAQTNQRYIVETITMTTVTEHRIIHEATDITSSSSSSLTSNATSGNTTNSSVTPAGVPAAASKLGQSLNSSSDASAAEKLKIDVPNPAKLSTAQAISGILKGGKLWKSEQQHQQQQQQHQQMQHQPQQTVQQVQVMLGD